VVARERELRYRCRAKREQPEQFEGVLLESQGQNLALTVLYVPSSLNSGWCAMGPCNHSTEMCSGSEAGSYLRLIDSCTTQLTAQGPSRTCNESKEEEEDGTVLLPRARGE